MSKAQTGVAVDVGGTFTDVVIERNCERRSMKVLALRGVGRRSATGEGGVWSLKFAKAAAESANVGRSVITI